MNKLEIQSLRKALYPSSTYKFMCEIEELNKELQKLNSIHVLILDGHIIRELGEHKRLEHDQYNNKLTNYAVGLEECLANKHRLLEKLKIMTESLEREIVLQSEEIAMVKTILTLKA